MAKKSDREARRALLFSTSAAFFGTTGCSGAPEATRENHAKVKNGQSEQEVLDLLGEPTSRGGDIDDGAVDGSVSTWTWGEGARRMTVTFRDGKVLGKTP